MEDPPELRDFTIDEIMAIARAAQSMRGSPEQRLQAMRQAHPQFWFRYPSLLEKCCTPDMDMDQLSYMLRMLSSVQGNTTTLAVANKEVQSVLADKYLPQELHGNGTTTTQSAGS